MQFSQALNPRRISRTLVTVLALSFIQTVLPPVLAPEIVMPKAEAVTGTVTPSTHASGTTILIPQGVTSVTFEVVGAAGGKGGNDNAVGTNGTVAGRVITTLAVEPGDVIGLYGGNFGAAGTDSASGSGGGAGGADTFPSTPYSIAGTYYNNMNFAGGTGGNAGSGGSSGGGGGAGAASIATVNYEIVAIAAGAGGGGGSGYGANAAGNWNGTVAYNGTNFNGANGASTVTCTGSNQNADGGGGGGGGGGYFGGAGGAAPFITTECAGIAGAPGGNYLKSGGTSVTNDFISVTAGSLGYVKYTYEVASVSACATNTTTVDIYTVVKVTQTINCTWTVPSTVKVVDLFAVGGGGGGGGDGGSGGGGGGSKFRTSIAVTPSSSISISVGYGGVGSSWGGVISGSAGQSTIVTLGSTTVTAAGGAAGTQGPASGAAAGGGDSTSGGFAGGAGGTSPSCFNVGGTGKTGSTNYFYGVGNEYGGGGGGGACPNGAATTAAAGTSGGGNGGYAISSSVNAPATDGLDGWGGGGGGGVATGTGFKLNAGKGGSGIVLIRYATNSADEFPSDLTSSVSARWMAQGMQVLDSTRKGWIDSSGTNTSRVNGNFVGNPTLTIQGVNDGGNSTFSSKSLLTAAGGQLVGVSLAELPSNYTLFHVARYITGGRTHRIIQTSAGNWLSGHYWGRTGAAHHNSWLTNSVSDIGQTYGWLLSSDQLYNYRANGKDLGMRRDSIGTQSTSTGFGINLANPSWNEYSDWQVTDVMVFNRELSSGEIRAVENHLARIYGLTLAVDAQDYETDTAATFDGNQYHYANYGYGNTMNDTFTVEAWVNPAQTCINTSGAWCGIFNRENTLVTGIYQGEFHYALYGTNSGWQWINTGVQFKAGEWRHISILKDQPACVNGSLKVYLDGQLAYTQANNPYRGTAANCGGSTDVVYPENTWTFIGTRNWTWDRFYGQIDEVKVWKVARTASQIVTDMHSNDVSSKNLQAYYDFNRNVGTSATNIPNLAMGAPSRSDMVPVGTMTYSDVKTTTITGPYTTIRFPRTYITQFGGWKVPTGIETATTIVVGGGGGGGFGGSTNAPAGAGGGGGVTASLTQAFTPGVTVSVKVGAGGIGGFDYSGADIRNGQSSSIGVGGTLTALGGGGGGNNTTAVTGGSSGVATGGGTGAPSPACTGSPLSPNGTIPAGATVPSGYNGSGGVWGWGGSGGGARGAATNGVCADPQAGVPGPGFVDPVTLIEYGKGGNAAAYSATSLISGYTTQNNGWGGIISYSGGNSTGAGYRGSFGTVIVRYITASKPTYTKPVNAYLNVGMTETFTTNVAQDSATAMLTRTFKWESSTAGSSGPFTTIKQGTGAANAAFSWIPTDTSTTGSQYLYRLTVTDSDTAGLFITDSSTAFAVINRTLQMTGVNTIKKAINVSRNDTFTVIDGTPNYRYTLTPVIPGITLDTSTVGSPVIKISDTATIGTFLETLTVIDSVSASVQIPLTITISGPPSLSHSAEIIKTGQIFSIDPSISASYNRATGTFSDISGAKHPVTITNGSTFSTDYSGILSLSSASSQYISATGFTQMNQWTIDAWVRLEAEPTAQFCVLTSEYAPTNISFELCVDTTRRFFTGFHNGSWTYKRSTELLPLNVWTHLVGTYDGSTVNLYINGSPITVYNSGTAAGTTPPPVSTDRIFLGKDYGTAVGTTATISYGSARLYNIGFTQSDVLTNYNATKDRFALANLNQLKPSQKYGTLNVESFTVTSGGDTKTVTFAVGNRTGITWDTSTVAGRINLSVQESLTPGTYYDTITVTDNFAQSTTLPITFTVSKADTITVIAGSATSQVFNNSPATNLPNFTISGLVSSDTGTVQRKYTGVDWTKPCAQGGGCEVGDTGPGGGTIFYISPTVINSATGISSGGTYLEVAPINWSGLTGESTTAWARAATSVTGTLAAIGAGAENTRLINAALTTNSVAAKVAADLTLNGRSDWFLPSTLEVKEIYEALYLPGLAGGFTARNYWSSTQGASTAQADTYWFGSGALVSPTDKLNSFTLRPIRAYSPDTITVTTVPTNADSYTVTVDTITMTTGLLSFYQNVIYQRSGLDITKARQAPLNVNLYGATFGLPFTVTLLGGSGTGAVTESLTAGSTATGCAIAAHVLTSTTTGTCNLQVRKAASRNYLSETATAIVYFLNWVINQPSNQTGGGATIGLNGVTAITRDPNAAPTISSLSTYTGQAGVTQILINGSGFNHLDTSTIIVKFWRNVIASGFTVNAGDSVITVTIPAGATTGKVTVTTPNGIAVSELAITITP